MAAYIVQNQTAGTQQANTSTFITLAEMLAATSGLKRMHLYSYLIGPASAPASSDSNLEFDIPIISATGTGTAFTPVPTDSVEAASSFTCKTNDTVEPTVTASTQRKYGSGNQRSVFSWVTNDFSQMIHFPATNGAGFCVRSRSLGYTGKVAATVEVAE